jgi:hypothetical protein
VNNSTTAAITAKIAIRPGQFQPALSRPARQATHSPPPVKTATMR